MIISPSILAADFLNLESELTKLEGIDNLWIHLDIMDGHFVPNLTFGHDIIRSISKLTSLPLDAHFMVSNPEFYIDTLASIPLHNFTFHLEATNSPLELLRKAKKHFPNVGLSIKPKTLVSEIDSQLLEEADLILVMSVEPGFGGQKFMPESLEKVKELVKLKNTRGLGFQIQIDGGITNQTAPLAFEAGADNLVAGSSIFRSDYPTYNEAIKALRESSKR